MGWQQQSIEFSLKNGKKFRTQIEVETHWLSSLDVSIRTAIMRLAHQGGLWYKGNFVNWSAIFSVRPVSDLGAETAAAHGQGD